MCWMKEPLRPFTYCNDPCPISVLFEPAISVNESDYDESKASSARPGYGEHVSKSIRVEYFSLLRIERGISDELVDTNAKTAAEFYDELKAMHGFSLESEGFKAVVNNDVHEMDVALNDGDIVMFIPPMVGG